MSWGSQDDFGEYRDRLPNRQEEKIQSARDWNERMNIICAAKSAAQIAWSFREEFDFCLPVKEMGEVAEWLQSATFRPAMVRNFVDSLGLDEERCYPLPIFGLGCLIWAAQTKQSMPEQEGNYEKTT